MSFAALHKSVTYLMAALGLFALSLGSELDPWSLVAIAIAFVGSLFVEGPRLASSTYQRAWNVGLIALLAIQIARGMLGAPILPLVLEYTAALQLSRLYNRRGAKEHQQIAALALLHLIAATVLSTELAYAFAFVGFVVVAPWMLALGHLRAEIEGQYDARGDAEKERSVQRVLASRRVVGPGFLASTAALALPLFAMTALLFLAFPRVGLGFLSFGTESGQRVTGFGSDVELGAFGVIRADPTVVMRVTPPGLAEHPPERAAIRMRGTSFDHYDGRRWSRSREIPSIAVGRVGPHYAIPRRLPLTARDRPWLVVLDALEEPVIFVPPDTVGLEITPRIEGGMEVGRAIRFAEGVDIRYGDADGLALRYVAWTSTAPLDRAAAGPLTPEETRRYLQLPDGHERVAALAREWTNGADSELERVLALMARLRDSGDFEYSLEMPTVGSRAPLDVFLFEARRGHCEYFSTALAIMLRTLGIPARNVTGFLGGAFNPYGRYYALAQGDAHSWVEAWLPGRGWIVLDPTPGSRDELGIETGWSDALRAFADAMRIRWAEHIVGYDLRRQVSLFRDLRTWMSSESRHRAAPAAPTRPERALATESWPWWLAIAVLVAVAWLLRVLYRRRRSPAAAPLDEAAREAVELYRALDRALRAKGLQRPEGRTPLEHVAALEAAGFPASSLVREVTERYVGARFGGDRLPASELARLERAVRDLRK